MSELHQTECYNNTCPKHDGVDEPIAVCDLQCPEPRLYEYGSQIIYGIDAKGVHHTTDARFYDYMIARTETPKKVIIHTTLKELKEVMHA